jgi:hypothetical protein
MCIWKSAGEQIGMDVDYAHKDSLKVLRIHSGGLIDIWNRKQATWKVQFGDAIVEINGQRGTADELMAMLTGAPSRLEVLVQKMGQKRESYLI